MRARIAAWLRTPSGAGNVVTYGLIAVFSLAMSAFDVPWRWFPGPLGWLLAVPCAAALGLVAGWFGHEVERWCRLRDEYAAAQRDIERMERGE